MRPFTDCRRSSLIGILLSSCYLLTIGCTTLGPPSELAGPKEAWSLKQQASPTGLKGHVTSTKSWRCKGTRGRVQTGGVTYEATLVANNTKQSVLRIGKKNVRLLRYFGFSLKSPKHQAWGENQEDGLPMRLLVYSSKASSKKLRAQLEIYTESGIRTQTIRNLKCAPSKANE